MVIAIADDERSFADDLRRLVESNGHRASVYYTLQDAWESLIAIEVPFVLVLDHDFGGRAGPLVDGYSLCERLRADHTFGLLLPIIYLTGRETERGFLRFLASKPHMGPTMFITKDQLAANPSLLLNVLETAVAAVEGLRAASESQAAKQALIAFGQALKEDADED